MVQNDHSEKVLQYAGLAARARRTVVGIELIATALKRGREGTTPLVILEAADSSDNTHKRIGDRAAYYGVPRYRLAADGARLANAVGKRGGSVAAVGVTEPQLARAIIALMQE